MARASASNIEEIPDSGKRPGANHPRKTKVLVGHDFAEAQIVQAITRNQLPSAWLIQGDRGIGKATFAYKAAKYLLADNIGEVRVDQTGMSFSADTPSIRQIEAGAHPDLHILCKQWNKDTKKFRQTISVDDVRKAIGFVGLTAGAGGHRIVIVDSADDLNRNGQNALLKTLEEPPQSAVFFLISHAPGKLPATIHSRCRHLTLKSLGSEDFETAIMSGAEPNIIGELKQTDIRELHNLSGGSPGRALELLNGPGMQLHSELSAIVAQLPQMDTSAIHSLAGRLAKPGADDDFRLALDLLKADIRRRAKSTADTAPQWLTAYDEIVTLENTALAVNLDKRRTILEMFNLAASHCPQPTN